MLKFHGIQPGKLNRDRSRASDAGSGVVIGDIHLAHITPRNHVALRRTPVTRHDNTAGVFQRDNGGAVRQLRIAACEWRTAADACRQQLRRLAAQEVSERR